MVRTFIHHVFATFTVRRDSTETDAWRQIGTNFNRFIQKFRRVCDSRLQYIRTVEAHQDGYPHIHAVLQFYNSLAITDGTYFDMALYRLWKRLWSVGLSDYQAPHSGNKYPILYIIKYISKDSATWNTLWKKLLTDGLNTTQIVNSGPDSAIKSVSAHTASGLSTGGQEVTARFMVQSNTSFFSAQFKIKQLTWSRGFVFPHIVKKGT